MFEGSMKFARGCLLVSLVASFLAGAALSESNSTTYLPYLEIGGTRYFKNQFKWSYGSDLWLPIWQLPNQVLFATLNFINPTGKAVSASATFGYRFYQPEDELLLGIYTGFDMGKDIAGENQQQLNFGVEWWQGMLFFGANCYLPFDHSSVITELKGNVVTKQFKKGMKGEDITIGCEAVKGVSLFLTGYGFYTSDSVGGRKNTIGGRALCRFEYLPQSGWVNKIALETGFGYDKTRKTTMFVGLN